MSWKIEIHRAKPNPSGKDRSRNSVIPPQQLLAEWVDLKNVGDAAVRLSTLTLTNTHFSNTCVADPKPYIYWQGSNLQVLSPGQIVRVHTGRSSQAHFAAPADNTGVDLHAYAEKGEFVLNNACGDMLKVMYQNQVQVWCVDDQTSYNPNPPDGAVLKRVGTKLVPVAVSAFAFR